jgi:flagellin-like hook-associated protein FlgL
VINTGFNLGGARATTQLGQSQRSLGQIIERLATGKRINRGADDPAGLIASENLINKEVELTKQIESITRRQYQYGATEGGLSVISDLLTSLNGVVVRGGDRSTLSTAERESLQVEANSIIQTIDYLAGTGRLSKSGPKVLGADVSLESYRTLSLARGQYTVADDAGGTRVINASLNEFRTGGAFDLESGDVEQGQKAIAAAISQISSTRAAYGSEIKAIDSEVSALQVELENTIAAKGLILDTDYAQETANLVREQLKQEAATFAVGIAQRQRADAVLGLLASTKDTFARTLDSDAARAA